MELKLINPKYDPRKIFSISLPASAKDIGSLMDKMKLPKVGIEKNCLIADCDEMLFLEGKMVNIDELQWLAERLDSFCVDEVKTFYAAAQLEHYREPKELIGLTFNLNCYFLKDDTLNKKELNKAFLMQKYGYMSVEEFENPSYNELDKLFEEQGEGTATLYGSIYRTGVKWENFYDGLHAPLWYYSSAWSGFLISGVNRQDEEKTELLCLPCTELEIDKMIYRMEADGIKDMKICMDEDSPIYDGMIRSLQRSGTKPALYALNRFFDAIQHTDRNKICCVCNGESIITLCSPKTIKQIDTVTQCINDFAFYYEADSYEAYGMALIDECCDRLPEGIERFILYDEYGKNRLQKEKHFFGESGLLVYRGENETVIKMIEAVEQQKEMKSSEQETEFDWNDCCEWETHSETEIKPEPMMRM